MKLAQFTIFAFLVITITSCDEIIKCGSLNQENYSQYIGSFSSYGSAVNFTSSSGDTISFETITSTSEPYECHQEGGLNSKACVCEANSYLLNPSANNTNERLQIMYSTQGNTHEPSSVSLYLKIATSYAHFRVDNQDSDPELLYGRSTFVNDTSINGELHSRVLIADELESGDPTQIVLSKEKGIICFTDDASIKWNRIF